MLRQNWGLDRKTKNVKHFKRFGKKNFKINQENHEHSRFEVYFKCNFSWHLPDQAAIFAG